MKLSITDVAMTTRVVRPAVVGAPAGEGDDTGFGGLQGP
jgi:hypothetical protein